METTQVVTAARCPASAATQSLPCHSKERSNEEPALLVWGRVSHIHAERTRLPVSAYSVYATPSEDSHPYVVTRGDSSPERS
jgi:hypothetical protein